MEDKNINQLLKTKEELDSQIQLIALLKQLTQTYQYLLKSQDDDLKSIRLSSLENHSRVIQSILTNQHLQTFVQQSPLFKEALRLLNCKLEYIIIQSVASFDFKLTLQALQLYSTYSDNRRNNLLQLIFQGILLNMHRERKQNETFYKGKNLKSFVKFFNEMIKLNCSFSSLENKQMSSVQMFIEPLETGLNVSEQLVLGLLRRIIKPMQTISQNYIFIRGLLGSEKPRRNNLSSMLLEQTDLSELEGFIKLGRLFANQEIKRSLYKREQDFSLKYFTSFLISLEHAEKDNLDQPLAQSSSVFSDSYIKMKQQYVFLATQQLHSFLYKHYSKVYQQDSEDLKMTYFQSVYCEISSLLDYLNTTDIRVKKLEISIRKFRALALKFLKNHFDNSMIDLLKKQIIKNAYSGSNQNSFEKHVSIIPDDSVITKPSKYAEDIGEQFSKWQIIDQSRDDIVFYQKELLILVFLLSLRRLQSVLQENKIKMKAQSAVQVAIDINYIIESILNSAIGKQDVFFREKLLNLKELKKWRTMINYMTEGQFVQEVQSQEQHIEELNSSQHELIRDLRVKKDSRSMNVDKLTVSDKIKDSITFMKH